MIARFWFGLTLPLKATQTILSSRVLLFWSLFPTSITFFLYFFALKSAIAWANHLFQRGLIAWGVTPHGWLGTLVTATTSLIFILIGALTFSVISSVVASPFNDFLAEHAERFSSPPLPRIRAHGFSRRVRLIWIDILKTLAATAMGILALVVSWIPVVNLLSFLLTLLLIVFQYVSYPQTRRGMSLGSSFLFLLKNLSPCVGFGITVSAIFAIPFLSIIGLPIAVVGGTLLFGGLQSANLVEERSSQ